MTKKSYSEIAISLCALRTAHEMHGGEGELVLDGAGELVVVEHELGLVVGLVRDVEEDPVLQLRARPCGYSCGRGKAQLCCAENVRRICGARRNLSQGAKLGARSSQSALFGFLVVAESVQAYCLPKLSRGLGFRI